MNDASDAPRLWARKGETITCINGHPISDNDARMIRRWRVGKIQGVTQKSADALLQRYQLTTQEAT